LFELGVRRGGDDYCSRKVSAYPME
jgi:hypothetical protein